MTRSAALRWLPPIALLLGALLWVLSPVDPLPDVVPVLGWLDDLAALVLGGALATGWVVASRPTGPGLPVGSSNARVLDARDVPRLDARG